MKEILLKICDGLHVNKTILPEMKEGEKTMRKILFRGKERDTGEWIEGYYLFEVDPLSMEREHHFIIYQFEDERSYCGPREARRIVDPDTVGQYTEQTDKNGAMIFEGDIVTMPMYPCEGGVINPIGVVVFEDGAFFVKWVDNEYEKRHLVGNMNSKTAEVVGNIFDNPELMNDET